MPYLEARQEETGFFKIRGPLERGYRIDGKINGQESRVVIPQAGKDLIIVTKSGRLRFSGDPSLIIENPCIILIRIDEQTATLMSQNGAVAELLEQLITTVK